MQFAKILLWTVILMAFMNVLATAIPAHMAGPLHHLLALICHLQFFTFCLTVACVLAQQWIILLIALLFIALATMQQPDFQLLRMVYPVAAGIITGMAVLAALNEAAPRVPPEAALRKDPRDKPR